MDDDTNPDQTDDENDAHEMDLEKARQRIRAQIRAEGGDPDEVRIIVGHKVGDTYMATEIQGYPRNPPAE
ncbi:hypothetical protein [Streptomyces sp. NPDC055105]|uniref:hypothetical protein n=1 Tax=Streptomyces sp. NPDC055105 TaxID=3365719 RepID=UPI0037D51FF1